jgi:hypothetical protein
MSIARARRYPQPLPAAIVLAGDRCAHGELKGRCALCRVAAEPNDDQDTPEPTRARSDPRRAVDGSDHDDVDPPAATMQRSHWPAVAADDDQDVTNRAALVEDDDRDPRGVPWYDR